MIRITNYNYSVIEIKKEEFSVKSNLLSKMEKRIKDEKLSKNNRKKELMS